MLNGRPSRSEANSSVVVESHAGVTFLATSDATPERATHLGGSTTPISDGPPSRRRSTAIDRPSGDHRGDEYSVPASDSSTDGCANPDGGSSRVARSPR